jgi:hypothetical protein
MTIQNIEDPGQFRTAATDRIARLYHWQRFNEIHLRDLLADNTIYCSDPSTFNDPWDCKPHFNTEILDDPVERQNHARWDVDLCRRYNHNMTAGNIAELEARLLADRDLLEKSIDQLSQQLWPAIAARYRIYCLSPDVGNLLMWSHYADNHRGICLEFSTRNEVMCCPQPVEYINAFPLIRAYSTGLYENLRPLLVKADVWEYEREYRLFAQERNLSTPHDTLMTDNNLLKLPQSALVSIIVGCQGPYDAIRDIVAQVRPALPVKQAIRVPNRFELQIQ